MKVERWDVTGRGDLVVRAADFDRVEAERDALQALLNERDAEIDQLTADARRYRYLMSPEVLNGTLGVTDGWIDFEFKEEAEAAIDLAIGLQVRK